MYKLLPKPDEWDKLGIDGCFKWENESPYLLDTIETVNPKNILEIGFFAGASSMMWLQLSTAKLTSVDPMMNLYDPKTKHDGKLENVQKLKDYFGEERFTFLQRDSKIVFSEIKNEKFDLMFIDGDHWDQGIRNDFQLALALRIPYILVDDFVTNVLNVYNNEFSKVFTPIKAYPRKDLFMGQPIPIVLLKNNLV